MSSVTYITSSPSRTANSTASPRVPEHVGEVPLLGVEPDRARPDEQAGLDRHARPLGELRHGLDVHHERPPGAVRADPQAAPVDLPAEPLDRLPLRGLPPPGSPTFAVSIPRLSIEVQDLDLGLQVGIRDRRALEPVAERLVVEHHDGGWTKRCGPPSAQSWTSRSSSASRASGSPRPAPTGSAPGRTAGAARGGPRPRSSGPGRGGSGARW